HRPRTMARVPRYVYERSGPDHAILVAQHEVHLPGDDEAELLFVRMLVQRGPLAFGLRHDPELHEFTGHRAGFDLGIGAGLLLLEVVQLVERHASLLWRIAASSGMGSDAGHYVPIMISCGRPTVRASPRATPCSSCRA